MSKESKTVRVVNFHPGEVVRVINPEKPRIMINPMEANVAHILPAALPFLS